MKTPKIRFGIVGTNFITDWILEAGQHDERFEAVALYSRTEERAKQFAAKHAIPHYFTTYQDMLASGLIDAVYIASPNALHAEQAIQAMRYGKHVLCEKPLGGNAREVQEMIHSAKENKVLLMEAMKSTYSPGFQAIRKHLPQIGKIRRYFASYCQYSSRYDKLKEGIVLNAFKPELCNGALMDIGVYTLYPMIALFGKPHAIKASAHLLPTGTDGEGSAIMNYEEMDACVLYSKIANSYLPSEIQGEEGSIIIDKINSIGNVCLKLRNGKEQTIATPPTNSEYIYEITGFIDAIQNKMPESPINTHAISLMTAEVMDEIRRQTGVIFPVDQKVKN